MASDINHQSPPLASVIVANWNGLHHLQVCLDSLMAQSYEPLEIILVDNNSSDGSQEFVSTNYPTVQLLELPENTGFTGANNSGLAAASGNIILLLNNDTEAHPDWAANIVGAFLDHPQVGIVASKILLYDRRDHFHSAGDFYSVNGLPGNRSVWQQDIGQHDVTEPVFSACAGAAGYRRQMIDAIGFLDQDFFFSCEDVDLSWRAHLAGWEVLYVPSAVVYHKLKATGGSETGSYYDGRNFLYLIWKNYPTELLRRHWPAILRAQWSISWQAFRALPSPAARNRLRGQLAGLVRLPAMWRKRKDISRRVATSRIAELLSPIDPKR